MSLNWGGGMAGKRIERALELDNDRAAIAWLKRQDEEMERERGASNWPIFLSLFLSAIGWGVIGALIYLTLRLFR